MCSPAAFGTVFGIASGITFGNTSGPSAPGIRPFTEYHRDIFGFIYTAAFAVLETCLSGCLSGISAPSTMVFLQHLRDHRRACDAFFTSQIPGPSRIGHRLPLGPPSGSSPRLPPRSSPRSSPDHLSDHLRIILARASAVFTENHRDALGLHPRAPFASIGEFGTRSRRRRAR